MTSDSHEPKGVEVGAFSADVTTAEPQAAEPQSRWKVRAIAASQSPRVRISAALFIVVVAVVVFMSVPVPTVAEMRIWAADLGPLFLLAFAVVNFVVILFPVPRTMFTVTGGVLFGVLPGIAISIVAGALAAVVSLIVVRTVARDYVHARISMQAFHDVNERLARRGWLAVASLRLIAPLPFSIVNYSCGLSSIRVMPFTVATIIGMIPGTTGVILLADAITGTTDPRLIVVSGILIGIGVVGLIIDNKLSARDARLAAA
ncbi:TVP38/TMEM64 family protein [Hoyosella rhizosphaerae]|nr:TVP38/TMEM64 family protein [Hoyosella rhizosphaerae]